MHTESRDIADLRRADLRGHGRLRTWFDRVLTLAITLAFLAPPPAIADEKPTRVGVPTAPLKGAPKSPKQKAGDTDGASKRPSADKSGNTSKKAANSPSPDEAKLDPRDAAFIQVQADFKRVTVTVNDKPYPVHSKHGAVVAPGVIYEVVVTDTSNSAVGRYKLRLKPGEARLIIAALSADGPAPAPRSNRQTPRKVEPQKEEPKEEEAEQGSGYLTVNATPTAQVYVDGKLVASKTPLVKHQVSPGNHTVRVYYVDDKKFSETKRAMITEGRHVNLYFQNRK